jgi:hypothetical protein
MLKRERRDVRKKGKSRWYDVYYSVMLHGLDGCE